MSYVPGFVYYTVHMLQNAFVIFLNKILFDPSHSVPCIVVCSKLTRADLGLEK
jgi:hypothetical protein